MTPLKPKPTFAQDVSLTTSLEGLEQLFQSIFEPKVVVQESIRHVEPISRKPLLSKVFRRSRRRRLVLSLRKKSKQSNLRKLQAEINLLNARFEHALATLNETRREYACLRLEFVQAQHRLRTMPDLLRKAARLKYLETCLAIPQT